MATITTRNDLGEANYFAAKLKYLIVNGAEKPELKSATAENPPLRACLELVPFLCLCRFAQYICRISSVNMLHFALPLEELCQKGLSRFF